MVVNLLRIRQLYHFTKVHDGDSVGNVTHHQQIMGNEQIGQTHLILQLVKHIDDLCLNGHVQCGHRLIADHKLGLHRQRPGNADTLPLTAGELMGVAVGVLGVQAHLRHQFQNPLLALRFTFVHLVHIQRLADNIGNGPTGIQRRIGILKDHGGFLPVLRDVLLGDDLLAVKPDFAVRGLVQVQQGAAHGGLAAAGLADETQRLAPADGEGHVVHSLQGLGRKHPGIDIEVFLQVLDFNQRILTHSASPPSFFMASRTLTQQAA